MSITKSCKIENCSDVVKAKGMCNMHWYRQYRGNGIGSYKKQKYSHGMIDHPLYSTWEGFRQRCNNPNNQSYKSYGGRGITVCERWNNFALFLEDMGDKPTEKHTLDRIDNDKGYSPENCRWATRQQQGINTRVRYDSRTGYRNIRYSKTTGTYELVITRSYATIEEAIEMRDFMLRKKPV